MPTRWSHAQPKRLEVKAWLMMEIWGCWVILGLTVYVKDPFQQAFRPDEHPLRALWSPCHIQDLFSGRFRKLASIKLLKYIKNFNLWKWLDAAGRRPGLSGCYLCLSDALSVFLIFNVEHGTGSFSLEQRFFVVNTRGSEQKTQIYLAKKDWSDSSPWEIFFLKFHFSHFHCAMTLTELLDLTEDKSGHMFNVITKIFSLCSSHLKKRSTTSSTPCCTLCLFTFSGKEVCALSFCGWDMIDMVGCNTCFTIFFPAIRFLRAPLLD